MICFPVFFSSSPLAEYAILSVAAFATAVHLILHVIDNRMTGAWQGKATAIMLLEFFSEVGFLNPNTSPYPLAGRIAPPAGRKLLFQENSWYTSWRLISTKLAISIGKECSRQYPWPIRNYKLINWKTLSITSCNLYRRTGKVLRKILDQWEQRNLPSIRPCYLVFTDAMSRYLSVILKYRLSILIS